MAANNCATHSTLQSRPACTTAAILCNVTACSLNTSAARQGLHAPQITLVSDKHDDDVGVSVVAQLLEPTLHVLERHCGRMSDADGSAKCTFVI